MSFLDSLSAMLPFGKKEEDKEYFFALNISSENLTAALWTIEGKSLRVLETASESYSSTDEIAAVTDKLLDAVLGLKEIEPQKILFGVPNLWLSDDNLKDEYLKILRSVVKELELTPMAYVATSNALIHFLEKQEGVPTTAILVGFEKLHLTVTVSRAGKLDGVKVITRGESTGSDIEKALLTFTDVETLPSKILIYGLEAEELRSQLLSFSWMSKLSFLHFPKIEVLGQDLEIKSVCLAGGSEINTDVSFTEMPKEKSLVKSTLTAESEEDVLKEPEEKQADFGFVVGDIEKQTKPEPKTDETLVEPELKESAEMQEEELIVPPEQNLEVEDFEKDLSAPESLKKEQRRGINFGRFIPRSFTNLYLLFGIIAAVALVVSAYIFLVKAEVKIYVEPQILEKDAQVVADPKQKEVDEEGKIIPGEVVSTEVSGSKKDTATGKRQIGESAKGTIVIYNKTSDAKTLPKGTQLTSKSDIKFTLDTSVTIASQSASDSGITFGKANTTVTASSIGADGNLSSGTDLIISGYSPDKMTAKAEGNFSGGTSKDVTVVSSDDQKRLLASLAADLRQQAQQKLQEELPNKKILQESLAEEIVRKSYNKNINDQASEFSLNLTVKYKGTAFEDKDLKLIVSKLVTTQVPEGFELDITQTETQADVSKLEKDGKLVFLARFKAKLIPKIDSDKIKNQIKFKTPAEVVSFVKEMDHVLGTDIKMTPNLPGALTRLPFLTQNIKIEVGLK